MTENIDIQPEIVAEAVETTTEMPEAATEAASTPPAAEAAEGLHMLTVSEVRGFVAKIELPSLDDVKARMPKFEIPSADDVKAQFAKVEIPSFTDLRADALNLTTEAQDQATALYKKVLAVIK